MAACGECIKFNAKEKVCNLLKRRCKTLRFGDCKSQLLVEDTNKELKVRDQEASSKLIPQITKVVRK